MADFKERVWAKYRKIVSDNPESVGQVEATSRVLSYIIAGRFDNSQVLSELVYLSSNLLVFLNDQILRGASKLVPIVPVSQDIIQKFLTILEYAEVFLEMASLKYWGDAGRWVLIVVVQITKTIFRLLLLWNNKAGIQTSPPISSLDRDAVIQAQFKTSTFKELNEFEENIEVQSETVTQPSYHLKRSGRLMRSLSAAPPMNFRSWKVPKDHKVWDDNANRKLTAYPPSNLTMQRMWAETLYICRPLVHLLGMYSFGTDSWKPWILSSGLDVSSLYMMGETENLNPNEKTELKKRTLLLLYYLLRSPFYDQYSKTKILYTLKLLANNVPVVGIFIRPMIDYLPVWQQIYFYLWST